MVGVDGRGRVDVCGYVLEIWMESHPFAICVPSKRKGMLLLRLRKQGLNSHPIDTWPLYVFMGRHSHDKKAGHQPPGYPAPFRIEDLPTFPPRP